VSIPGGCELAQHTFEILKLDRRGENWLAQFAVDGVPYPPFYEPHSNVVELSNEDFLDHMKASALTMVEAVRSGAVA